MADNNKVNIQITAEDLASAVIRGVEQGFKNVANSMQATAAASKDSASNIATPWEGVGFAMMKLNAAIQVAQQAWRLLAGAISPAIAAIETYQASVVKTAAMITSFQGKDNVASNYQKAKVYAEGLAQQLEIIDQRTIANAQDLALMTEEMMKQRIVLDVNNQKQVDGFVNIANAAKVVTNGMGGEIQMRQEIRALMKGQVDQNSVLASQVQAMVGGSLKEKVELWKREGTLIENIGGLLTGYAAASGDIQSLWSTITSSMQTLYNQVLRGGMTDAFKEIVAASSKMLDWAKAHKDDLNTILHKGWLAIKGVVEAVFYALGGQETVMKDLGGYALKVADAFGVTAYVVLPVIGKMIGKTVQATWDWVKVLGNSAELWLAMIKRNPAELLEVWKRTNKNMADASAMYAGLAGTNWADEFYNRLVEYQNKIKGKPVIDVPTPKLGQTATEQFKEAEEAAEKYQRILEEELGSTLLTIRKNVADGLLSETEGKLQSLAAEKDYQQKVVALKQAAANKAKELFGVTSEEYTKAAEKQGETEKTYSEKIIQQVEAQRKAKKEALDTALAAAQNAYQEDLNNLQESENNKSISIQEAHMKRLQLARDYADQVASIRAKELSDAAGQNDPKAYETALKAKLDADKAYLTAKQAINDEEARQFAQQTAKHGEEIKARIDAEKSALEQSRAFAAGWFGMWDNAYNQSANSLKALSDAAYNTFAELENLPLKSAESLEALKQKAAEAAKNYGNLYRTAQEAGLMVGAAWSDAYTRLNMIPAEAARITAEFYSQKVAAEELATALDKPVNATSSFVSQAEQALLGLGLLDKASLDRLKGSIDQIKNAMLQFTDKVREALKSLQDEWDNLTMSKLELEEKRYQEQKTKWQQEYKIAQDQQNADAMKALQEQLDLIEKIHKANAANLSVDPANTTAPKIPGMARGGNVGGSGIGDNQLRWLDPREWVINPGAVSHWGTAVMAAMNNPMSQAGQMLADRINGLSIPAISLQPPRLAMAAGGNVGTLQQSAGLTLNLTINTTQPIDDTFIRRKIIPELDRYARGKA